MPTESAHAAGPLRLAKRLRGAEDHTLDCMRGSRETLERGCASMAQPRGRESEEMPI